jgi:hypothetical protein
LTRRGSTFEYTCDFNHNMLSGKISRLPYNE